MLLQQTRPPDPVVLDPGDASIDAAIVDLVSRGAVKVPPYPAVALRVDEMVRRQDYGLAELSKLVASDQALAADALRCANSAFYSRGSEVTALGAAITRIGGKEVVRLALASGLGAMARKSGPLSALKRRIWLEALASAALAQELARKRSLPPEEAFVCGLLHDFGKMVAVACVEEILRAQRQFRPRPVETWVALVERYHVELGLVLATQWQLPQLISDVISLHHADDRSGAESPAMVELMATADEVVALLADRSWITAEDLGAISSLDASECELTARVLEKLPGFIAAFEGASPVGAHEASAIEAKAPGGLALAPKAVDLPVAVTVNRIACAYRATHIASSNLTVSGPAPLPENVLMEVKIGGGESPALTCWATAKLSWPEGGAFTVLLQPFALNGPSASAWKQLARPDPE